MAFNSYIDRCNDTYKAHLREVAANTKWRYTLQSMVTAHKAMKLAVTSSHMKNLEMQPSSQNVQLT